jgi:hypothetical protein
MSGDKGCDHLLLPASEVAVTKEQRWSEAEHVLYERGVSRKAFQDAGDGGAPEELVVLRINFGYLTGCLVLFDEGQKGFGRLDGVR